MSNLTFDDLRTRENRENNDKNFFKFREFFDEFRKNMQDAFEPGAYLCIDETLFYWRGRCG